MKKNLDDALILCTLYVCTQHVSVVKLLIIKLCFDCLRICVFKQLTLSWGSVIQMLCPAVVRVFPAIHNSAPASHPQACFLSPGYIVLISKNHLLKGYTDDVLCYLHLFLFFSATWKSIKFSQSFHL